MAKALGLSSWEKKKQRCDLLALYSFLSRGGGQGGGDLVSLGSSYETCGNGAKLYQGRLRLDIRDHLFTERMIRH